MNFTYSIVHRHLSRWFMSRWGDIITDPQSVMDYVNLTIQDIYNEDNATFTYKTQEITWVLNWDKMVFTTEFPMRKIQKAYSIWDQWQILQELKPTLFPLFCDEQITFSGNQILAKNSVTKILVVYVMDYTWANYPEDMTKVVPLPNRYLPVLLKLAYDWASPISLMDWEMQTTDFYDHWISRLNKLKEEDWLTDYIDVAPRYF